MLLTTHYMDEAERLCDRLAIIDQGKIIAERYSRGTDRGSQRPPRGGVRDQRQQWRQATMTWARLPGVQSVRNEDGFFCLQVDEPHHTIPALLSAVQQEGRATGAPHHAAGEPRRCVRAADRPPSEGGVMALPRNPNAARRKAAASARHERSLGRLPGDSRRAHERAVARAGSDLLGVCVSRCCWRWAWASPFATSLPT